MIDQRHHLYDSNPVCRCNLFTVALVYRSEKVENTAMKGQTLMLITDISGYTRFITRVGHEKGIQHAQDLLQIIINSNTLGLKLCEVEGDAVFFYAMKELPSRKALMRQISRTYNAFNHYLSTQRLESELGIKFFVHTGICEEIRIGGRTKLYGMEVIKIHRLLKSITNTDDYMLITANAGGALQFETGEGVQGGAEFPHIGVVNYAVFNERFLQETAIEVSLYHTFINGIIEAANTLTAELSRQYRHYAALLNPLHEMAS